MHRRAVGLMSGTSIDGIDAVVIQTAGRVPDLAVDRILAAHTLPFDASTRTQILDATQLGASDVRTLCLLHARLGEWFARAAQAVLDEAGLAPADVCVIGSHGQTVWHEPEAGATLQLGEPAVIAERTGVTVVADFRPADLAAGGQGAPLVPFVDYVLLRHATLNRAVQNIGGIGNVTWLPAGGALADVVAFDTGPGNMIVDELARRHTNGRLAYDVDGAIARSGAVREHTLAEWMRLPYLHQPPPKSTGRELFGPMFVDRLLDATDLAMPDLIATATAFTAETIADAHRRWLPGSVDEVLVCGGGADNPFMMERLARAIPDVPIRRTDAYALPAEHKEAVAFAVLALATLDGQPSNTPAATGAAGPRVLGKICPAPLVNNSRER